MVGSLRHGERKAVGRWPQGHVDRHFALGTGARQQALHLLVVVAVQALADVQTSGHLQGEEVVALGTVHAKALQLLPAIDKAEAVAIGKGGSAGHDNGIAGDGLYRAYKLADSLGRVERCNGRLATIGKIGGVATVEGLAQVGTEAIGATPC